ncbi:hypothetical protein [Maricaulis maris]|uniref:hypothetical protein n=1 Tax=Maricaulis maris TaxID=74318 RepID=UPI003B8E23ED
MLSKTLLATSLAVMAGVATAGLAEGQTAAREPVSGTLRLDPSQGPQRFDMSISAGGDIEADDLGRDCAGEIADAPSLRLHYGSGGDMLRVFAMSNTDTSLVIQTPSGDWLCNDDAMGGLDPILSLSSPQEGEYNIWVGRVSSFWGGGDSEPVELGILNIDSNAEMPRYLPTYATLRLTSGFQPSELDVRAHANGAVRPPAWDNRCGAVSSETPALNLEFDGNGSGLMVRANGSDDLTLMVRTPNGDFVCNDELEAADFVDLPSALSGAYTIWVGPQVDRARSALIPVSLTLTAN